MARLTVSLDQLGALREVRKSREPDPAQAAMLAEMAGADGIAVQLRRDRRFIRDRDLYILRELVKSKFVVETTPTDDNIATVEEIKPGLVILVADNADTDRAVGTISFDVAAIDYRDLALRLSGLGIRVCVYVEPDANDIKGAAKAGAQAVMLNCAAFTRARDLQEAQQELDRIDAAAQAAARAGLGVVAGRGVDYKNVAPLAELNLIDEFVIGHAIAARAMLIGYEQAVREMLRRLTVAQTGG